MAESNCPVCNQALTSFTERPHGWDGNCYDCPNCGAFKVFRSALTMLGPISEYEKAILSHRIWQRRGGPGLFEVDSTHILALVPEDLPGPDEQLDNFISYWGEKQGHFLGTPDEILGDCLRAKLGAFDRDSIFFVVQEAINRGLFEGNAKSREITGRLTFKGWEAYRRIERGQQVSRHAFMAMPFGNDELDKIVDEVFRPAVQAAGFTLRRLDEAPEAGVIDNRMRVEIRQCKFLIADLTHDNRGAYWEAGYAEGLGKPVIYTCEKSVFDDKSTHFDTNHCTTVVWDREHLPKAAAELTATIRNTFPFEAKMPPEPAG